MPRKPRSLLNKLAEFGIFATVDELDDLAADALAKEYCAHNYEPLPLTVRRAEGSAVWDSRGKHYFDMIGSYSALSHGHRNSVVIRALKEQCDRVTLTSRALRGPELPLFMAVLCEYAECEMGIPMNTGAEAVETAIKIARKWAYLRKGVPRDSAQIIVASGNFHGRTTTIVGFSSEPQYKELFGPYGPGFVEAPFGDLDSIRKAITPNTAALLIEPIQAEAGIIIPPDGYLSGLRKIASENNVLLIWDEIQTGFSRTGKRFAWQWEPDAVPDLMTLGKALGGGVYPVSAVVGSRNALGVLDPGDHGSTFGGNPLASIVGLASLIELHNGEFDRRAQDLGERLRDGLSSIDDPRIVDVRGRGLLVGLEIGSTFGPAAGLLPAFLREGVITKDTHRQTLRFAPPLTMTDDEMDEVILRIGRAFMR